MPSEADAKPRKPRPLHLKVDPERFPDLGHHPALERALLIRQAMEKGFPREQAIQVAELSMGDRAPRMSATPKGRPKSGPRPASKKDKPGKAAEESPVVASGKRKPANRR